MSASKISKQLEGFCKYLKMFTNWPASVLIVSFGGSMPPQ